MSPNLDRYTGQPNPGATIPLPITGRGHPVSFGFCSCRKPADAIVRRPYQANEEPMCASCADRLGVPGIIDLSAFPRLPERFRTEEAMRALGWKGTGIALARSLHQMGFERRRDPSGFIWLNRLAA